MNVLGETSSGDIYDEAGRLSASEQVAAFGQGQAVFRNFPPWGYVRKKKCIIYVM